MYAGRDSSIRSVVRSMRQKVFLIRARCGGSRRGWLRQNVHSSSTIRVRALRLLGRASWTIFLDVELGTIAS